MEMSPKLGSPLNGYIEINRMSLVSCSWSVYAAGKVAKKRNETAESFTAEIRYIVA